MTNSAASARPQPDWSGLSDSYRHAEALGQLTAFRKRRWDRTSGAQTWLEQANIPSIKDGQIGILYRGAGGRNLTKFRTNAVADIHDAMDFLLYDTIKLESRFDECASESGAFSLEGTGREWPSYLLTLQEPRLFAPWNHHTDRALRRLGMYQSNLRKGHSGLSYLDLLEILEYLRVRLQFPDFRTVDEFCYVVGRAGQNNN